MATRKSKRRADDLLVNHDEHKRPKMRDAPARDFTRPVAPTLTPYAVQFGPSDYELFNQNLFSDDLPNPEIAQSGLTPKDLPLDWPLLTHVS